MLHSLALSSFFFSCRGDIDLPGSLYYNNSKYLYDLILEANDAGDYFPVWGTCQGFEQLAMLASNNLSILNSFDAEDISLPLKFTKDAENSKLFGITRDCSFLSPSLSLSSFYLYTLNDDVDLVVGKMPQHLWNVFRSQPITQNLHSLGVDPDSFQRQLSTFFRALSTNVDINQKEFISTIESINYPIYATQFHPERNAFEWFVEKRREERRRCALAHHFISLLVCKHDILII
jgi:gamma-glutamyl hydrolase